MPGPGPIMAMHYVHIIVSWALAPWSVMPCPLDCIFACWL